MKRKLKRVLGIVIEKILYVYCIIFHRMKVEGRENIPMDEPVIFCGNHRTFLDPVLIKITAKRNCHFLAKGTLYKNKFLAFLGWVFETIPVLKDSKDINANKNISSETIYRAINNLSCFLNRYYKKNVIILLDEYDTPMQEAYVNGYWDEIVAFTRSVFST